jgi:hypothetical protein
MADLHEYGCKLIVSRFSVERRGRLVPYNQGLFRAVHSNNLVKVGQKGVPDLVGWSFPNIATFVEVKTNTARYFRKEQKTFMDYAASNGCICICFREQKDGTWREFLHGEDGFY